MSSEHKSTVIFGSRADLRAERKRKRDESGDWDKLSHPDLRSILQQKERLGNILMKYYPTLLHLPCLRHRLLATIPTRSSLQDAARLWLNWTTQALW